MTKEEIIEFCEMKAELESENEDIYETIIKELEQKPKIKVLDRDEVAVRLGTVDVYMASAWVKLLEDLEYLGLKICEAEKEEEEYMIEVKYPENVEEQLKIIDERIEEIYRAYANLRVRPEQIRSIKIQIHELIKPFVDEKVRLIKNCRPKYIVNGVEITGR